MAMLMLRKSWSGNFHRTVWREECNEKGEVIKRERVKLLEFQPGVPIEVQGEDLEAVRGDIGTTLLVVEVDAKNRPRAILNTEDPREPAGGMLDEVLAELKADNARLLQELTAATDEIAQLREQLAATAGGNEKADVEVETESNADDVPLGDEVLSDGQETTTPPQTQQHQQRRGNNRRR